MRRILVLFFFLSCTSCGYHWGKAKEQDLVLLNVPYAKGDQDGAFTAAMIQQLSESSLFQYDSSYQGLILKISLKETGTEHIGYRHDRNDQNLPKKSILPTEGREKVQAEVTLVEGGSERVLLGPLTIESEADFDFLTQNTLNDLTFIDPQGERESLLNFSMGQLEPISSAQESARKVALSRLAKRIVQFMMIEWEKIDGKNCH